MKIDLDINEIIPLEDFSLNWRWDNIHNPNITIEEIKLIQPLSVLESKRINKIIDYYEDKNYLNKDFVPTDWFLANSETEKAISKFIDDFSKLTQSYKENLFISWNPSTCVYTTKDIFIKYWNDFCYPSSDDITIISEMTNWVYFYNHLEIGQFWKRKR